jgi:hypothetical protein
MDTSIVDLTGCSRNARMTVPMRNTGLTTRDMNMSQMERAMEPKRVPKRVPKKELNEELNKGLSMELSMVVQKIQREREQHIQKSKGLKELRFPRRQALEPDLLLVHSTIQDRSGSPLENLVLAEQEGRDRSCTAVVVSTAVHTVVNLTQVPVPVLVLPILATMSAAQERHIPGRNSNEEQR